MTSLLSIQKCMHCGSEKIHPLEANPSMVICQMCGKLTEIGAESPKPKTNPTPKVVNSPKKVNRHRETKQHKGGDRGGRMRWTEEEDKLLIRICENPTLKIAEIHRLYIEQKNLAWLNRTHKSVKNRVSKLRSFGLINFRYKPLQTFKCPYCGGEFHIIMPKKK